ncbi:MAG: diacylglycerol kinase family lipid kinase [Candidatus Heimdallarchaeota archaeon]|nr:diacylglycerol kinase family lipid kinase [Candidatus Heimdallarchaeota archaeon]MCK4253094.1 diacylglycerol kinase family lipid kinase [Candidatus Heimdallarchaeota archaeon]
MTTYLFVINPNARNGGIGKMWPKVEEEILKRGLDHKSVYTQHQGHAIEIVKELEKDFDCVVAVGGDGTINEVTNGLYGTDKKFGLIPLGNGNDFAISLDFDDDFKRSLDILEAGKTIGVTVGIAETNGEKRYFVNVADTGVGATVSVASFTEAKWLRGFLKYYYLAFKKLLQYRLVKSVLTIDDQLLEDVGLVMLAVGSGSRFGGGFNILPENYHFMDDFAVLYARDIKKLSQINLLNSLKPGKHLGKEGVYYLRAKKVTLEMSKPLPIELEGEILSFGATNVSFEVAPQKIQTIVSDKIVEMEKQWRSK